MTDPRYPLPELDWEPTRGFWEAAAREVLAIPRCNECQRYNWYPTAACKHCGHESLSWTATRGRGTLFSYAVVERALFKAYASKAPYVSGLIALDEDPAVRLVTLVVDCPAADLTLDMPMQVAFRQLSFPGVERQVLAPCFTPMGERP